MPNYVDNILIIGSKNNDTEDVINFIKQYYNKFWDTFYQGVKQTLDSGGGGYNAGIPQRHGKVIFMKEAIKQYQKEHPDEVIYVPRKEDNNRNTREGGIEKQWTENCY